MDTVTANRLLDLKKRLAEYREAESKILQGQSYSIGSRQLTRTSLAMVQKEIKNIETQIRQIEETGSTKRRIKRIVPIG